MIVMEILVAVVLFTGIVAALGLFVLAARSRLVPSAPVTVTVNDERDLVVTPGVKLLGALGQSELFLPSACGGGGTCGQCQVRVLEGGGDLLPTEKAHINRKEAATGLRLACQVSVDRDLRIEVPSDVFGVSRWTCTVRSNRNVATFIKELVLELPAGEQIDFRAGGYIQIECPPHHLEFQDIDVPEAYRDDWERYRLF